MATKKGAAAKTRKAATAKKRGGAAKTRKAAAKSRKAGAAKKGKAAAALKGKATAKARDVLVRLSDEEGRVEELRAARLGGDLYRLEEAPSFAYSVSLGDTVRARAGRGGALVSRGVEAKSGNRTLRLLFSRFAVESPEARPILEELERLGCVCTHAQSFVLRLTLPPEVSLAAVVEYVKALAVWWEHADPTRAELSDAGA